MAYSLESVNADEWDAHLQVSPYASPFHEYPWNEMAAAQFGADFQGYVISSKDRLWLLPIYQRDGQTLCSFVGYGGPVSLERTEEVNELANCIEILEAAKSILGATAITGTLYPNSSWEPVSDTRIEYSATSVVPIHGSQEDIFSAVISGNCRTAIRKAMKSGVKIHEIQDEDLAAYGQAEHLLQITQARVGSTYATPASLLRAIGTLDKPSITGATYIAEVDGQAIAMSTVITNRREMFNLFNGWDREFAHHCANQALHWHAIQAAIRQGVENYNMGESHNPNILSAKSKWGAKLVDVPKISL